MSMEDSLARHAQINKIEEQGFQPSSFRSDADSSRSVCTYNSKFNFAIFQRLIQATSKKTNNKQNTSSHDRAMFGPMWAKKEIEEQMMNQKPIIAGEKVDGDIQKNAENQNGSRFPLAHELVDKSLNTN